eukprot:108427-Amphidinium_carterae.1
MAGFQVGLRTRFEWGTSLTGDAEDLYGMPVEDLGGHIFRLIARRVYTEITRSIEGYRNTRNQNALGPFIPTAIDVEGQESRPQGVAL